MLVTTPAAKQALNNRLSYGMRLARQWQLQLMAFTGALFLIIFAYIPMFGIVLAFKNADHAVDIMKVLREGPWVGLKMFETFLKDDSFGEVLLNTVGLNLVQLCINFPAPILFALMINEVRHNRFKRTVQSISYFPHFISWIVFGGIVTSMLSVETGFVNPLLIAFGIIQEPVHFLGQPDLFWGIIVITSLLKGLGWGSIIYLAAITTIDPSLYEAATIDGAGRFRRMWHITLPSIVGTILVFFILSISNLLSSGFDHIWVFQSPLNMSRSEVIDTYVYRVGITQMRYSYTTAVGLFKSAIALILLMIGNGISLRLAGRGIF